MDDSFSDPDSERIPLTRASKLTPSDLAVLTSAGLISPARGNSSQRTVRGDIGSTASWLANLGANTAPASTPSITVSYQGGRTQRPDYVIPMTITSRAGLEYIGFEAKTARRIFDQWSSVPDRDDDPCSFWDCVLGHISRLKDEELRNLPPAEAMKRLGVRKDVRDRILNPRFKRIFQTASLVHWVVDTLRVSFLGLVMKLTALKGMASERLGFCTIDYGR